MEEIRITTIDQFYQCIFEQPQTGYGRWRSHYAYRGLPNPNFKLTTSLQLNCRDKSRKMERNILNNFAKYAEAEDPSVRESIWRRMILGQHHGLPTRLMDWTHSGLVAAHFAMTEANLDKLSMRDCVIWRIDVMEMNELLPLEYKVVQKKRKMDVFTLDMLIEAIGENPNSYDSLDAYDRAMEDSAMVVIEPPSIDPRIVNQYAFFTVVPMGISDIEGFLTEKTKDTRKYIISKELRWMIRDILDEANMNERMIYPGLDGISQSLKRHYYVRGRSVEDEEAEDLGKD